MSDVKQAHEQTAYERRKQVIQFSYWAIDQILSDCVQSTTAELLDNQRTGKDISRPAARLAALDEISQRFQAHLTKEKT